jgi:hypothetical protein
MLRVQLNVIFTIRSDKCDKIVKETLVSAMIPCILVNTNDSEESDVLISCYSYVTTLKTEAENAC